MKPPVLNPETDEEWQNVFDICIALRSIADCRMYGLLTGGPHIVLERVDCLLDQGRRRGLQPSRPDAELAAMLVTAWNGAEKES